MEKIQVHITYIAGDETIGQPMFDAKRPNEDEISFIRRLKYDVASWCGDRNIGDDYVNFYIM